MAIKKNFILIAVLSLVISLSFLLTERMLTAQGNISESAISNKLDEILNNQKAIMQGLEAIRTELDIVKIRITQQQ